MPSTTLRELLIEQLADINDAEQRIVKALPKLAKAAQSEELSSAFEAHLEQTREHVNRLNQVFDLLGESPRRKTCKAIVGLLAEGDEVVGDSEGDARDAALIAAAQKVEHYEMATYGCLRTWADLVGESEASRVLQETLDEEGETDKKLTEISESLNVEALDGDEDTEEVPARPGRSVARRTNGAGDASKVRAAAGTHGGHKGGRAR